MVLVVGLVQLIVGAGTWHTVASRPHVTAQIQGQYNCVYGGILGTNCDEFVDFKLGIHEVIAVVRSVEPSRDLWGPPGYQHLAVFYDPAAPTHVGGVHDAARRCFFMMLAGLAIISGVALFAYLTERTRKRRAELRTQPSDAYHPTDGW